MRDLTVAFATVRGERPAVSLARPLPGRPPDLMTIPERGCVFRDRCPIARPRCAQAEPPDAELPAAGRGRRRVACFAVTAERP